MGTWYHKQLNRVAVTLKPNLCNGNMVSEAIKPSCCNLGGKISGLLHTSKMENIQVLHSG